ncbi:MAG: arginase family protein [Minicystis sp.]
MSRSTISPGHSSIEAFIRLAWAKALHAVGDAASARAALAEARALDDGCIAKLVQVGIRANTPAQQQKARAHDVLMLGADEIDRIPPAFFDTPLYVTIDLDGLDPAFAPGVSHPEPGGLSTREVLALLRQIEGRLLGADVVERNPERDESQRTTGVAVRLVKELLRLCARPVG